MDSYYLKLCVKFILRLFLSLSTLNVAGITKYNPRFSNNYYTTKSINVYFKLFNYIVELM